MPAWCKLLCSVAPFLVALKSRLNLLMGSSFGLSRTISWLQDRNITLQRARASQLAAEQAASRALAANDDLAQMEAAQAAALAADRLHKVERRLSHWEAEVSYITKVRRDSPNLMLDAEELMFIRGRSKTSLEVQFKNESGFGRGVTQGFYSSVCNALQSPEENANVCMWTQGRSGSGLTGKESQKNVLGGNRGLFPNAWPHADVSRYKSREEQAARRKILGRFRFLGRLLGAALCDGFVAPIPIATEFFELLLGEKPDFVTAASLIEGEAGFISGLATVSSSLRSIRQKAAVQGTDSTKDERGADEFD